MTSESVEAARIKQIQKRAYAAAEGPWEAWDRGIGHEVRREEDWPLNDGHRGTFTKDDAEFIAHSRKDIPYLLNLVREQAATIERVRALAESVPRFTFHGGSSSGMIPADAVLAALTATEPTL